MESRGLTALEVCEGETKIRLEKQPAASFAPPPFMSPYAAQTLSGSEPAQERESEPGVAVIKSPMVGVFFAASAPDAEPFIQVGTRIQKGDVLCIIEAMKLMNELIAETEGQIIEILVSNGEIVEFGQPLFRIISL